MVEIGGKLIGLDTNIFIYYFAENKEFGSLAKTIFEALSEKKTQAVTSIITLTELLSLPASEKEVEALKTNFLETPNLNTLDINQAISIEAARIRRTYGFRIPDSIQLATCLHLKADIFITNDERLKSFKELPIILINKSAEP